jgi:hypothetical protein
MLSTLNHGHAGLTEVDDCPIHNFRIEETGNTYKESRLHSVYSRESGSLYMP